VTSCADLVRRARALDYTALGLCDEATMSGFEEFDSACRAHHLRPVFGCRLLLAGLVVTVRSFPLDFLIETEQGYRNLVRLLNQYNEQPMQIGGRRRLALVGRTAGLVVVHPPDGELADLVRLQDRSKTEQFLAKARECFGVGQAVGVDPEFLAPDRMTLVQRIADFIRVPALAAPIVEFADPADAPAAIFLEHPGGAPGRGWNPPPKTEGLGALLGAEQMEAPFDDAPLVRRTAEIARRCEWRPEPSRRIVPAPQLERGFDANSFLFDLAIRGAGERYGEIGEDLKDRIKFELESIKARDLAAHLLLHRQIVGFLDERGISRGIGRGPIIASVVAYCIGLTRIDPLAYRLAPQPLTAEGEELPPIRIEIPSAAREKLIAWLESTFGESHFVRIGRRLDARREHLIDAIADWAGMIPEEREAAHREKPRRASAAQRLRDDESERRFHRWREPTFAAEIAGRLAPRPKGFVPAPGRWTLTAEQVEGVFPLTRGEDGGLVTSIGEAAIDRLGGPRLELSPHHYLNLLDRARLAAEESERGLKSAEVPLDDRATFDLLDRGDTLGIPAFDGVTAKILLRRGRASGVFDLIKIKTDAGSGRSSSKPPEPIAELPDVLLSYQCAYFKAHHPEAFFAGALSSALELGRSLPVLARAIRRAGIEILPPDINLSVADSTVHGGAIRLGLRMVRQLGDKTLDEILEVRRGGRFNSLAEFCEGLSPKSIRPRALQNLIAAGAFDSFGQGRARLSALVTRLQRKRRADGAEDEEEKDAEQFTLFDMSELDAGPTDGAEPEIEGQEDWDEATAARLEREALGFNLRVDPMERFTESMASLKPLDARQVTHRLAGRAVRVAGLIDAIDEEGPMIEFDGGKLIDLEGLPVWLNPTLAEVCSRGLEPGAEALVIGEVATQAGYARLDAIGLWRLQDLEDQARRVARVKLDLTEENKQTVKHLFDLTQYYPGEAKVETTGFAQNRNWKLHRLARQRIYFCSPFYQGLCKILPAERIALFDAEDKPLSIAVGGGLRGDGA
jgi:DNA polymerase III alpha subunit